MLVPPVFVNRRPSTTQWCAPLNVISPVLLARLTVSCQGLYSSPLPTKRSALGAPLVPSAVTVSVAA
jgi:hypothetical protein